MLKNMRLAPSIAATISPALVRSPTITSAPIARSWSARSSSRRTMARTCAPPPSNSRTTRRLMLPIPPPAPVIRYMTLVGNGPDRGGDQIAAVQPGGAMLRHLQVLLVGHHVAESRGRRMLDDDNGLPPRLLAFADDHTGRCTRVTDGASHPLQMRRDLAGVADVALHATVGAELQQVDHHDRLAGRAASAAICSGVGSRDGLIARSSRSR